jgi:hypothetical protein
MIRPRVDQLPGTLTDFYSIQEGFALVSDGLGIVVATPDTHLIQLGALEYGPRPLHGAPELEHDNPQLYSWVMTNFWETNFAASLGGFHEFRYFIKWSPDYTDPSKAIRECANMNHGICCFRMDS